MTARRLTAALSRAVYRLYSMFRAHPSSHEREIDFQTNPVTDKPGDGT
jgi:hypothetical protein